MVSQIETARLLLRPLSESDRDEYLRVHTVSAVHFRPWFPDRTGDIEASFRSELAAAARGDARWVGVGGDRLIGFFNLSEIVRGPFQNAYISWAVSADAQGKGLGREAVGAMLDLAFAPGSGFGLHRVQANILPENARSLRLAESVGMRREGYSVRYLKIAGAWRDHIMYAKTREDHALRYLAGGEPGTGSPSFHG